jgi:CheY-like chemotaxis protein
VSGISSKERAAKTIRASEERVTELLDRLDKQDSTAAGKRSNERFSYRRGSVTTSLQQPGDSSALACLVHTRCVGQDGIDFLHGSYVHIGSACSIQLVTLHGSWEDVTGTVLRCEYVEGSIHEVSVKFNHPIDPSLFAADAAPCRVLLVDDDPAIARLASFHLAELNAHAEHIESSTEAIEKALESPYDLILLDIDMPELDGLEVVAILRSKGYSGLIAAFTSVANAEDRIKYIKAGFDQQVDKPVTREVLAKLLETIREEPVHSLFHNDPAMANLIDTFVAELPPTIRELETSAMEKDGPRLAHLAQTLMESAGGYGFDVITEAAASLQQACLRGDSVDNLQPLIDRVVRLCRLARGRNCETASDE